MERGLRPVLWALSVGAVLLAAASTAHVAGPPPGAATPVRSASPSPGGGDELAAAIRDNTPLPVLLTDTSVPPATPALAVDPMEARLIEGTVEEVFYGSARVDPQRRSAVGQALKLFAHRLDLTRDVDLGDRVRLVVRGGDGPARLDYAEFAGVSTGVRLYRGEAGYIDESGLPLDRFLLRTPLAVARITSGFGPRQHPLLGYTRMHRGVDFAAANGTPVLAAADGVVAATGWDGGYGRRIMLRHADGFETLYAHLSGTAPSTAAGATVRQGQVIGWTGETGQVTGPHLHFEVRSRGVAADPAVARPPAPMLSDAERRAFEGRKQAIAQLLAGCERGGAGRCV